MDHEVASAYATFGGRHAARRAGLCPAVLTWMHSTVTMLDGTVVHSNCLRVHDRLSTTWLAKDSTTGHLQGLTDLHGRLVWISDGLPAPPMAFRTHGVFTIADRTEFYLYTDKG